MAEIYGLRWTTAYGEDPDAGAGETWAKGLAGISSKQLAAGLTASIASADPWPPTLPEFRARCLGIPPLSSVRLNRASPFAVLVWQYIDGYRYRQASNEAADRILREAYELARDVVMRGGRLPEPAAGAIEQEPERKPVPASRETALEHLQRCRAELGVVPPRGAQDDTASATTNPVRIADVEAGLRQHYAHVGKGEELDAHLPDDQGIPF